MWVISVHDLGSGGAGVDKQAHAWGDVCALNVTAAAVSQPMTRPVVSRITAPPGFLPLRFLLLHGYVALQELQIAGVNFKAFDLGGHEIARKVWKDYYAKVCAAAASYTAAGA